MNHRYPVNKLTTLTLQFTDNITYWQNNYFYHPFQKSITWWKWGGKDIKIYGTGVIDGNGQAWYDGFAGREILVSSHNTGRAWWCTKPL